MRRGGCCTKNVRQLFCYGQLDGAEPRGSYRAGTMNVGARSILPAFGAPGRRGERGQRILFSPLHCPSGACAPARWPRWSASTPPVRPARKTRRPGRTVQADRIQTGIGISVPAPLVDNPIPSPLGRFGALPVCPARLRRPQSRSGPRPGEP